MMRLTIPILAASLLCAPAYADTAATVANGRLACSENGYVNSGPNRTAFVLGEVDPFFAANCPALIALDESRAADIAHREWVLHIAEQKKAVLDALKSLNTGEQ